LFLKAKLTMDEKKLECVIEAILFAAGDAVALSRLESATGCNALELEAALFALAGLYSYDSRGIRLVRVGDTAQLVSAPEYAEEIRAALEMRRTPALSGPSLEVLAIIAANQPTTRAYIEQVRGVDSSYTVGSLMDKGIIEEAGRLDVPGRPILLKTTDEFLRIFGVSSIDELKALPEVAALRAEEKA
jgi:segregation and condensation protein B